MLRFMPLQNRSETKHTAAPTPPDADSDSTSPTDSHEDAAGILPTDNSAETHEFEPEYGGVKGPEPTRYGDWEKNGRCVDF